MTDDDALGQLVAAGREGMLATVDSAGGPPLSNVLDGVIGAGGRRPSRGSEAGGA